MRRRALVAAAAWAALGCASQPRSPAPVAEGAGRSVLTPRRFGWTSSGEAGGPLPSAIALGGETSGRVALFFDFEPLNEPRRLLRADLRLDTSGVPGQAIEVELEGGEDSRPATVRLSTDLAPARLDVSELVSAQTKSGALHLSLRAEPGQGEPVLVQTGAAGGQAPRLELYWE